MTFVIPVQCSTNWAVYWAIWELVIRGPLGWSRCEFEIDGEDASEYTPVLSGTWMTTYLNYEER